MVKCGKSSRYLGIEQFITAFQMWIDMDMYGLIGIQKNGWDGSEDDKMDTKMENMDAKMNTMEAKMNNIDAKMNNMDAKINNMDSSMAAMSRYRQNLMDKRKSIVSALLLWVQVEN